MNSCYIPFILEFTLQIKNIHTTVYAQLKLSYHTISQTIIHITVHHISTVRVERIDESQKSFWLR